MKKRFISVFVAVLLVVSLFSSITVSAIPPSLISEVDFTYTGYVPGGELPKVTIDEAAKYRLENLSYCFLKGGKIFCYGIPGTWILTDETGAPVSSQTTVPDVSDCDYIVLIIDFHPKEEHTVFDAEMTVTANGGELSQDESEELVKSGEHGWYLDDVDALFAIISLPLTHLSVIENVAVTVPENLAGKTAESIIPQIKIPENTVIEKVEFRDENGDAITGALPKDAKKANIYIILKAKEGYCFATTRTSAYFNSWCGNDVTVNGKSAQKVSVGNERSPKGGISNQSGISPDNIVFMSVRTTIEPLKADEQSPKTGDNSAVFLAALAMVVSLAGIGKSVYSLRKS